MKHRSPRFKFLSLGKEKMVEPDFLARDMASGKKKTPGTSLLTFIILLFLTPLAIILICFSFPAFLITKMIWKNPRVQYLPVQPAASASDSDSANAREFDVVIFGATGFVGTLASKYLAKQYGPSGKQVKWAIAGRRANALKQVVQLLEQINPDCKDTPVILADSNDYESLKRMALKTKVVVSSVGPFAVYGTNLVRACIETATSYCDTTGETGWVVGLIDQYDEAARKSGARIVSFCGNDCLPWDLSALMCAKLLKEKGETLENIELLDQASASASGGTLETVLQSVPSSPYKAVNVAFSPMLRSADGHASEFRSVSKAQHGIKFVAVLGKRLWTNMFIMVRLLFARTLFFFLPNLRVLWYFEKQKLPDGRQRSRCCSVECVEWLFQKSRVCGAKCG